MFLKASSHAAHLLMEVVVGVIGVLGLAACLLAWRLAQGPIDITSLVQREQALLVGRGAKLSIGGAALAWEGFVARDQPLDIRVRDVRVSAADGGALAHVPQAHVTLSIGQLLLGRLVPRTVAIDGASVVLQRQKNGTLRLELGAQSDVADSKGQGSDWIIDELVRPARSGDNLPWLSQLQHVVVRDASVSVNDAALGVVWQAPHGTADFTRLKDGGVTGRASLDLAVGSVHATLTAQADMRADGTHLIASTTPLSPASLADVAAPFAGLRALDAPVRLELDARLGPALAPLGARLNVSVGAGKLLAGQGQVGLQSADVVFVAKPLELRLESARVALASLPGKGSPPIFTASAVATPMEGKLHATFKLAASGVELADLGAYWPPGTGGGSRAWLVENLVAGHVHDAHVEGALETPADFSTLHVTALSGSLAADDVSVYWLRPIPPLTHGHALLTVDGPDSLHITMDGAAQGALRLTAGSAIQISKLEEKHQFGDIDVRMAGPVDAALGLLNHPRLKLLTRSGLDFTGASGQAQARLKVHLPLEDKVTMDDIRISATASLSDVHLGKIAAGRDLDRAALSLKVDNDGLALTGHGDFSAIPTDLGLDMDFRDGRPDQVVQHVTAHGQATAAQLAKSGLPEAFSKTFAGGSTALSADYTARRNHTATLLLDADLQDAALKTPFGWEKAAGAKASAGARLAWQNGALVGIDRLHAQGPGLLIASHATLQAEHARALVLDTLELGRTRAHGEITFPTHATEPLAVTLSGSMLDVSSYLEEPPAERAKGLPEAEEPTPRAPEKRGQPWQAALAFSQVQLAKGKIFNAFKLSAASDGLHITRATIDAGAPGEVRARLEPGVGNRRLSVTVSDAGVFLRGMGVADNIVGGTLRLDGVFADTLPGDPLTGTATLSNFDVQSAPAIGRLLQAMTLYGLADVLRGPGLHFSTMVAPYRWQARVLTLHNARAFSPSLGLTAEGDIDLAHRLADIRGTLVPAYFFNQLLGDLPLVGKLFSPEKGGGVFAARYSVRGKLSDPKVGVNPLAALTPGFLREGFGLFSQQKK